MYIICILHILTSLLEKNWWPVMQSDGPPGKKDQGGGGRSIRKAKGKPQDQAVEKSTETSPAEASTESKDLSTGDLRRCKTAGEALLRPSTTDGLIARVSKISTLSLIDKIGTPRAALQRQQNASTADAASAKSQDDLQRILKDYKLDSDDDPRGEIVPLNNMQRQEVTLSLTAMQRKLLQRGIGIELVCMPPPAIDLTIRARSAKNAPRHILQQVPAFLPS